MIGGCYDGIYGVFGGFEVVCVLNDVVIEIECLVDVVIWINEEGLCFVLVMVLVGVFLGVYMFEYGLLCIDGVGWMIGEEFEWIGYVGVELVGGYLVYVVYELYIE